MNKVIDELANFRTTNPDAAFAASQLILDVFSLVKVTMMRPLAADPYFEKTAFRLREAAICNLIHLSGSHDLNSDELRKLVTAKNELLTADGSPVRILRDSLTEDHQNRLRDMISLPHGLHDLENEVLYDLLGL